MDDDEFGGAPPIQNRNQAFGQGMVGGQVAPGESLLLAARRYNAAVPRTYRPSGSLNGMSAGQYQSTLGGAFPTQNGIARNQYDVAKYSMRRAG